MGHFLKVHVLHGASELTKQTAAVAYRDLRFPSVKYPGQIAVTAVLHEQHVCGSPSHQFVSQNTHNVRMEKQHPTALFGVVETHECFGMCSLKSYFARQYLALLLGLRLVHLTETSSGYELMHRPPVAIIVDEEPSSVRRILIFIF